MKITLAVCYDEEGFKMTVNHENLKFEEKSIDLFQIFACLLEKTKMFPNR